MANNCKATSFFNGVPLIDLSKPDSKNLIVKACEEFGFFKVINHSVPTEFITKLESEAIKFFSSPLSEKQKAGPPDPFGYGNKQIGRNGDFGWVEHILVSTNSEFNYQKFASILGVNPENIRDAVNDYVSAVKKMACEILEMLAEGLKIHPRNVFSKLLMDEKSDSVFRLNHYPPCPEIQQLSDNNLIGFGEHTDPQIISVLRSNNTSGLQILLKNGHWFSVPPDENSFFLNVGDSLQVMTNGKFKSVKHRVLANSMKSRLSMIYFGGPPLSEKIAPLASLMEGEDSLYKEFTWFEYKKSAYKTRLADNRLILFEKIAAS
ncbi:PREDICTED: gibberellin 2-beta-dioxygenase 1-like [Nicotiana attenuata]|uniref:gibberellin 2beta-dioxygenase n=1 Tax=Nicotiana attenuata TaxID=49451 RepID=M9N4U5_NICAT|nr:PREDICTED: gibberellin 2-beta-dioxygenase 1-like [Nicotiana attenuata]AFA35957.1 gibberellin 2-oxidase [Nicotiana attenuata]OIT37545.1 gibberellin 2-beta-dioxygenase 1 [Nicotiana attenuata]